MNLLIYLVDVITMSSVFGIQLGVMLAGSSTSVLDLTLPIIIGTQPLKQTLVPGLQSEYRPTRRNHWRTGRKIPL